VVAAASGCGRAAWASASDPKRRSGGSAAPRHGTVQSEQLRGAVQLKHAASSRYSSIRTTDATLTSRIVSRPLLDPSCPGRILGPRASTSAHTLLRTTTITLIRGAIVMSLRALGALLNKRRRPRWIAKVGSGTFHAVFLCSCSTRSLDGAFKAPGGRRPPPHR
jgi:hypothetical protein